MPSRTTSSHHSSGASQSGTVTQWRVGTHAELLSCAGHPHVRCVDRGEVLQRAAGDSTKSHNDVRSIVKYKTLLTQKGNKRIRLTLTPEEAEDLFTLTGALSGGYSAVGVSVRATTDGLWDLLDAAGFVEHPDRLHGVSL